MKLPPLTPLENDVDTKNLEKLLETFGSVVSLEDIASAYYEAGHDLYVASEILCNLQESTSFDSTSEPGNNVEGTVSMHSEDSSEALQEEPQLTSSRWRRSSSSMGTVSSMIGRDYVRGRPSNNESRREKPMKLHESETPSSAIWGEKLFIDPAQQAETMSHDVEDFLFKMLGDGFRLDTSVIHSVLGQCGFDITTSVDKLIDISASKLVKSDDIISLSMEDKKALDSICHEMKSTGFDSAKSSCSSADNGRCLTERRDKEKLQKEILEALFNVPQRCEENSEIASRAQEFARSRACGRAVAEPWKETTLDHRTVISTLPVTEKNDDEDTYKSYDDTRKTVKQYWMTMKEYYRSAIEAFSRGDHEKSNVLLDRGHFFKKKAQEADEKSAKMLTESRDMKEAVVVDLEDFEPKSAIRILKVQLSSLSGIPGIQYLKVIVSKDTEAINVRRKRLILKFLERDSIKWTEEDNGRIIVVRVDEIDPKNLSFGNKTLE